MVGTPLIVTVPLTASIVRARADHLRDGQNTPKGPKGIPEKKITEMVIKSERLSVVFSRARKP